MKKAASSKGDSHKINAAVADMQELEPPGKPTQHRFKSNDTTTEKLGDLLTANPQGLLVFRDELIGLLASWEKEGREGDGRFTLKAGMAQAVSTLTASGAAACAFPTCVCLCSAVSSLNY
jgi:hypothetical protein